MLLQMALSMILKSGAATCSVRRLPCCFVNLHREAPRHARLTITRRSESTLAQEYDSQIRNHPLVGQREQPYDPSRPFFPIFYNDVYEVVLPQNHRFPMQKYGKVRRLAQTWISSLSEKERANVVCGASGLMEEKIALWLF
jgi:hypothetical protein